MESNDGIKLVLDRENHFVDRSDKEARIRFPDTQIFEGYTFRHVGYGVYRCKTPIEIPRDQIRDVVKNYREGVHFHALYSAEDHMRTYDAFGYFNSPRGSLNAGIYIKELLQKEETNGAEHKSWSSNLNMRDRDDHCYCKGEAYKKAGTALFEPDISNIGDFNHPKSVLRVFDVFGFEIEDGIWYFLDTDSDLFDRSLSNGFDGIVFQRRQGVSRAIPRRISGEETPVAMLVSLGGYQILNEHHLHYLAIGEDAITRLEKIEANLGGDGRIYVILKNDAFKKGASQSRPVRQSPTPVDVLENNRKKQIKEYRIPSDAQELVEGIGFRTMRLGFSTPFMERPQIRECEYAYIEGDKLVMLTGNSGYPHLAVEKHALALLDRLYVIKETTLSCGIPMPITHTIIDRKDEKLQELLSPEGYLLYLNEMEMNKPSGR